MGLRPAKFHPASCNRKLAPVHVAKLPTGWRRFTPVGPRVSSTYVSISSTCPTSCTFRNNGCYAQTGFTGRAIKQLDAVGATEREAIDDEVRQIDSFGRYRGIPQDGGRRGKSGRDLRLHVAGDVRSVESVEALAAAATRWKARGGGDVWTYTHAWRSLPRAAWGPVSVLASVEDAGSAAIARLRGYVPAVVVAEFPSDRAFDLPGLGRVIPCPGETRGATCVECRLCLDADALARRDVAIGFAVHGNGKLGALKRRLRVLADAPLLAGAA